jgi:outer membrane protein assembly factor BamA
LVGRLPQFLTISRKGVVQVPVKIGEVQSEMTADVKKTEDLKVMLKAAWSERIKEITFKPAEDLKRGDKIKISFEKV